MREGNEHGFGYLGLLFLREMFQVMLSLEVTHSHSVAGNWTRQFVEYVSRKINLWRFILAGSLMELRETESGGIRS